jgi:hypothetical protein
MREVSGEPEERVSDLKVKKATLSALNTMPRWIINPLAH